GLDESEAGVAAASRLGGVGDVLAEVVEGDVETTRGQLSGGRERVVEPLTGDEAVHHRPGEGRGGDQAAQALAARGGQQHGTEDGHGHEGHLRDEAGTDIPEGKDRPGFSLLTAVRRTTPRSQTSV